jgi:uncharacterized protein (DUF3820 family)
MNRTVIKFGKYSGQRVYELQSRYLLWLSSQNFVSKDPALLLELIAEIGKRLSTGALQRDLLATTTTMAKESAQ